MICSAKVKFQNLSASPQSQGFTLAIDKSIAVEDPSDTLQFLTVTPLDQYGNPGKTMNVTPELVEADPAAYPGKYVIGNRHDPADSHGRAVFVIPGNGAVEHHFEYRTRHTARGREDFCMRDATVKMTVRVPQSVAQRYNVFLTSQCDLPNEMRVLGQNLELEVDQVLLPMQGVVMHWNYQNTVETDVA